MMLWLGSEIMSLYDYGLLKQSMERKGIELGRCANSQISVLGKTLSRLMELKTIPLSDIQEVSATLEKIKDLIKNWVWKCFMGDFNC